MLAKKITQFSVLHEECKWSLHWNKANDVITHHTFKPQKKHKHGKHNHFPFPFCITDEHNWAAWGHWSQCDKHCGGGSKVRVRECVKEKKEGKGDEVNNCQAGGERQAMACNTHCCPGRSRLYYIITSTQKFLLMKSFTLWSLSDNMCYLYFCLNFFSL